MLSKFVTELSAMRLADAVGYMGTLIIMASMAGTLIVLGFKAVIKSITNNN
jgi:hypothetical protein